ncbi:MAG: primosomal protein N', partial [Clostridiales bacterium]
AMSYHADAYGGALKCHYCGRVIRPPERCPKCNSPHIRRFGVGTQRVVDEVQKLFPTARVLRLDSDVTEAQGGYQSVYQQMREGQADILVGTQMLAKGLDFPQVRLAAVIAADTMLNLPDWRACERTFQLISQLSGRAGRREIQGRAIIQTYMPEALPIVAAANADYQRFYQAELQERQLHGYPPFCHLVRLLFTGSDQSILWRVAREGAAWLAKVPTAGELCGPAEAPFSRIKDRYRIQIVLKTERLSVLKPLLESMWPQVRGVVGTAEDVLLHIDVDPFSMM